MGGPAAFLDILSPPYNTDPDPASADKQVQFICDLKYLDKTYFFRFEIVIITDILMTILMDTDGCFSPNLLHPSTVIQNFTR